MMLMLQNTRKAQCFLTLSHVLVGINIQNSNDWSKFDVVIYKYRIYCDMISKNYKIVKNQDELKKNFFW